MLKIKNEPWRFYHTCAHINDLLERLSVDIYNGVLTTDEIEVLGHAIEYHDIVYLPDQNDSLNVEQSIVYMRDALSKFLDKAIIERIANTISYTDYSKTFGRDIQNTILYQKIREYDLSAITKIVNNGDSLVGLKLFIDYEDKIFREYGFVPHHIYLKERGKILNKIGLGDYIQYLLKVVDVNYLVLQITDRFDLVNKLEQVNQKFDKFVLVLIGENEYTYKSFSKIFNRNVEIITLENEDQLSEILESRKETEKTTITIL